MDQQQGNRRWGHPGNARSLTQGLRPRLAKLVLDLLGQTGNSGVIDIGRQLSIFTGTQAGNFILLTVDVTRVLGLDFDLLSHLGIHFRAASDFTQAGVINFRAGQQVEQVVLVGQRRTKAASDSFAFSSARAYPGAFQPLFFQCDGFTFGTKSRPARVINQPQFAAFFSQAQVCVVFAQNQSVFGPRGKHAVRFLGAQSNQVIHQHADIGLVATWAPAVFALCAQGSVGTGE